VSRRVAPRRSTWPTADSEKQRVGTAQCTRASAQVWRNRVVYDSRFFLNSRENRYRRPDRGQIEAVSLVSASRGGQSWPAQSRDAKLIARLSWFAHPAMPARLKSHIHAPIDSRYTAVPSFVRFEIPSRVCPWRRCSEPASTRPRRYTRPHAERFLRRPHGARSNRHPRGILPRNTVPSRY